MKILWKITLILFFSAFAQAADVVFDLDWTLVYPTSEQMQKAVPEHVVGSDGELFRFSDHAIDVILALHRIPGLRISFFSGGTPERNQKIIEALYREIHERESSGHFQPYKVLNKEHLTVLSTDPHLKFWQRYQKDLSRFFDPEKTLLIEDLKEFVPASQSSSLLWLGKTYNDRPFFELKNLEDPTASKYSAPNYEEWQKERSKLVRAFGLILKAREIGGENLPQGLQKALEMEKSGELDPVRMGFRNLSPSLACKSVHRTGT